MVSSKTLRTFVKEHEQKLNAKMENLRASHQEQVTDRHASSMGHLSASAGHWGLREADMSTRHRPKSRYFDFILTSTHR